MKRSSISLVAVAGSMAALWCGGCQTCGGSLEPVPDEPWTERPSLSSVEPDVARGLAQGLNAFAVDLYQQLGSADSPTSRSNRSFSPASIAVALSMTLAGARGETAAELVRVMHLGLPPDQVHPAMSALIGHWTAPRNPLASAPDWVQNNERAQRSYFFELSVANRIFGQQGEPFEQPFVDLTRARYGAPLLPIDFRGRPDPSRRRINAWVKARTRDRIEDLIPPGGISSDTRLALVNAMYFKAGWARPFESHATHDGTFMAGGTRQVTVKTMRNRVPAGFAHHGADGLKALEMVYVEDDFSMIFLLPDQVDGLPGLEKRLTAESLERWTKVTQSSEVKIALPKFQVKAARSEALKGPLSALGLKTFFDAQQCDLTGMARTRPPLVVGEVFHQSFVAINEDGTEAAAATSVQPMAGAAMRPPPPEFIADHPFLFLIRDRQTGAILFMGRVIDPTR